MSNSCLTPTVHYPSTYLRHFPQTGKHTAAVRPTGVNSYGALFKKKIDILKKMLKIKKENISHIYILHKRQQCWQHYVIHPLSQPVIQISNFFLTQRKYC